MATEIMVEGADELARALKRLPDEMRATVLGGALARGGATVLRAAQDYAPKGPTGELAQSLEIRFEKPKPDHADIKIGSFSGGGKGAGSEPRGEESYQHGFVELGTAHNPARPYLRPALDSTKERVVAEVTRWLRILIARVGPSS